MKRKNKIGFAAGAIVTIGAICTLFALVPKQESITIAPLDKGDLSISAMGPATPGEIQNVSQEEQLAETAPTNWATINTDPVIDSRGNVSYVRETTYLDNKNRNLPEQLFEIPFRKTKKYRNNRETQATCTEAYVDRVQDYVKGYIQGFFGTSWAEITESQDAFISKMTSYYNPGFPLSPDIPTNPDSEDGYYLYRPNEYMEEYSKWLMENEIQANVDVVTDDSLVYVDNYTYIRGIMTIIPVHAKEGTTASEFLPAVLLKTTDIDEENKQYEVVDMVNGGKYIFEAEVGYYGDAYKNVEGMSKDMMIRFRVLDKLEDKT